MLMDDNDDNIGEYQYFDYDMRRKPHAVVIPPRLNTEVRPLVSGMKRSDNY